MKVINIFDNDSYRTRIRRQIIDAFRRVCTNGGTYRIDVNTLSKDNTPRIITKTLEFEPVPLSVKAVGSATEEEFVNKLYYDLIEKHKWVTMTIYDIETEEIQEWKNQQNLTKS